jgi:ankyrin repeat protein
MYNITDNINLIIEKGWDIDSFRQNSQTILMIAVQKGNFDLVKKCIKCGANVNLKDEDGFTALIYSAFHDNIEISKYLIKSGADITIKTDLGNNFEFFLKNKDFKLNLKSYIRNIKLEKIRKRINEKTTE